MTETYYTVRRLLDTMQVDYPKVCKTREEAEDYIEELRPTCRGGLFMAIPHEVEKKRRLFRF